MDTETEYQPVKIHVVKDDTKVAPVKKEYRQSHRTYNISANNPAYVAGYDPNRTEMRISVITGPVVLCDSLSAANDSANNTGTLANPNGRVLPQGNAEYILIGPGPVYFAAPANTQVSVTVTRC
jgi:hypothetical protein